MTSSPWFFMFGGSPLAESILLIFLVWKLVEWKYYLTLYPKGVVVQHHLVFVSPCSILHLDPSLSWIGRLSMLNQVHAYVRKEWNHKLRLTSFTRVTHKLHFLFNSKQLEPLEHIKHEEGCGPGPNNDANEANQVPTKPFKWLLGPGLEDSSGSVKLYHGEWFQTILPNMLTYLKMKTAINPHKPPAPWTGIASRGSSILKRSKSQRLNKKMGALRAPTTTAAHIS